MALILTDSFPYDYNTMMAQWTGLWNTAGANRLGVATGGRFGGRYFYVKAYAGSMGGIYKSFGSNFTTLLVQFGYCWTTVGVSDTNPINVMQFIDGTAEQITLVNYFGYLQFRRGATILGSSSVPIGSGWRQLEIQITIDSSVGAVLLKQDNATVINLTNQNTQSTANAYVNGILLGYSSEVSGHSGNGGNYYSDLIVMDTSQVGGQNYCNSLLGFRRLHQLLPTADGNYKQWTPSTGTNRYATVDEVPPVTTDYNSVVGAGGKDTFAIPDLTTTANVTVDAVTCRMHAARIGAASAKLKGVARSNSIDGLGTEATVSGTSGEYDLSFIYVDPNTGSPWAPTALNSAELGYQRSA